MNKPPLAIEKRKNFKGRGLLVQFKIILEFYLNYQKFKNITKKEVTLFNNIYSFERTLKLKR